MSRRSLRPASSTPKRPSSANDIQINITSADSTPKQSALPSRTASRLFSARSSRHSLKSAPPSAIQVDPQEPTRASQINLDDLEQDKEFQDYGVSTENVYDAARLRFFAQKALQKGVDVGEYWLQVSRKQCTDDKLNRQHARDAVKSLETKPSFQVGLRQIKAKNEAKARAISAKINQRRASLAVSQSLRVASMQMLVSSVNEYTPMGTFIHVSRRPSMVSLQGSTQSLHSADALHEVSYSGIAQFNNLSKRLSLKPADAAQLVPSSPNRSLRSRRGGLDASVTSVDTSRSSIAETGYLLGRRPSSAQSTGSSVFITGGTVQDYHSAYTSKEELVVDDSHVQHLSVRFKTNVFYRVARIIGIVTSYFKYLGRVLKNPIEQGWEYDFLFTRVLGLTKCDLRSVGDQTFKGRLIPEIRVILQKLPEQRTDMELNIVVQWASTMKGLRKYTPALRKQLLSKMRYEKWGIGRWIVKQGLKAKSVYVILDGSCVVYINDKSQPNKAYLKMLGTMNSGDSFGELAIKNGNMRSASIQTSITTEFLLIDNEEFDYALSHSKEDNEIGAERLKSLHELFPLLKTIRIDAGAVSRFFDFRVVPTNTVVVREGQMEDTIWFLSSGSCRVLKLLLFEKIPNEEGSGFFLKHLDTTAENMLKAKDKKILQEYGLNKENGASTVRTSDTQYDKKNIVTKLVKVRDIFSGDYFGEHPSSLVNMNINEKTILTDGKLIAATPSNVTVITNNRCDLVGINRMDFHRFSTEATAQVYKKIRDDMVCPSFEMVAEQYLEQRAWDLYKKDTLKQVVHDVRSSRHKNVCG